MKKINKQKGITLILSIMLMTTAMFMIAYLHNSIISENKISQSLISGESAYYLAESGIQEMIAKLKNDPIYKNNFENDPAWKTSFSRSNPFGPSLTGYYEVSIQNTSQAHANIIATGTAIISGKQSQRVIKTSVYRAIGESAIGSNAIFSDRDESKPNNIDLTINNSYINIFNGGVQSNKNFEIKGNSTVYINGDIKAVKNYIQDNKANVNFASGYKAYDMHSYPPPVKIDMPAVDFNSSATSSLKKRANVIYTETEFSNLIKNNSSLTLNGPITYVSGNVVIEKNFTLNIIGLLVIEGEFEFDGDSDKRSVKYTTNLNVATSSTSSSSGIFALDKIRFEKNQGYININGVIYAGDIIKIEDITSSTQTTFNVHGSIIGRNITIDNCSEPINIYFNNIIVSDSIGGMQFSPIITVEHWEEEY